MRPLCHTMLAGFWRKCVAEIGLEEMVLVVCWWSPGKAGRDSHVLSLLMVETMCCQVLCEDLTGVSTKPTTKAGMPVAL